MAGNKKKKRAKYVSRGVVGTTGLRQTPEQKVHNKHLAWLAGKNPWLTITNTAKNALFKRVRANDYWGRPPMPGFSWKGGGE